MRGRLPLSALAAAAIVTLPGARASSAGTAHGVNATGVSTEELRDLARRAETDPRALEELRSVDEVDGHPFDLEGALEGADDGEVSSRLGALNGDAAPSSEPGLGSSPSEAQNRARSILEEPRFRPPSLPRPLRGLFDFLGRRLQPVLEALGRQFTAVAARLPGGRATLWSAIAAAVVAGAAILARRAAARAVPRPGRGRRRASSAADDPLALERLADEAERAGQHERAVRLRFRAGLLRLDDSGIITFRPSITSGEVARIIRSPDFDELAAGFDEIAYGGRPAGAPDAAAARQKWPRVLSEAS